MRGAGGSDGGIGQFFIGLVMMLIGGYLFLDAVNVSHHFSFGAPIYSVGGFHLTSGLVMIPFLFGVGMIFYNADNYMGWALVAVTLILLTVGIISSIHFSLRRMSAFELMLILGLAVGGLGLFLSSLRKFNQGA